MEIPADFNEISRLPCVDPAREVALPECPGIYFVCDSASVLYIGKALSLRGRWAGGHHKALELVVSGVAMSLRWFEVTKVSALDEIETDLIELFRPALNRQRLSETKMRGVRLDDEVWAWVRALPGRTINEALRALIDSPVPAEHDAALLLGLQLDRIESKIRQLLELAGHSTGAA